MTLQGVVEALVRAEALIEQLHEALLAKVFLGEKDKRIQQAVEAYLQYKRGYHERMSQVQSPDEKD